MKNKKNNKGFTLVEVLFAITIGLVVMGAIYVAINSGQRSSVGIEQKIVAQQDARGALEVMSMEIGMASFNPTFATGIWINPAGCTSVSANQAYRGIQVATATAITVEMDILPQPENGTIGEANEVIAYDYDAANRWITRTTNCGNAVTILGATAAAPGSVRVINADLNIPIFRYFNGLGTEIAAAELPAAIPNIRRIEITLAIETQNVDPDTRQRRRMVYSNSVIPRNHVIVQ